MKNLVPVPGKQNANLYTHAPTGIIYVRIKREARGELLKSTRTTSINDARKLKDTLIQEWLGPKQKKNCIKLVEDLWKEFEATKTDMRQGTIDSIKYSGKNLMPFFGSIVPAEITPKLWEEYIVTMRKTAPERRFFNEWKWFNMFITFLMDNSYLYRKPKLRNPDPKRTESGKVYSMAEIHALLESAEPDLKLQILMGYTMGMRIGEILNLWWDRISLKKRTITLREADTKIKRKRVFGIADEVFTLLSERDIKTGPLFPSPNDHRSSVAKGGNKTAWSTCRRNAKVTGRFHDLRHTFLTNAFKNAKGKIDSMLICEYAGLSIEQAQQTYLHFDEEDTRLVCDLVKT